MLSRGFALLLAVALNGLTGFALAQTPPAARNEVSPFVGRAIAVDITAPSAAQAREQAIAEAERRAVQQVLRRLTLAADHNRLPQPAGVALQSLIEGMEVRSERGSATRYIARIDVAFRRAAIRTLLRQAGIPFAETRARPALLLPLLDWGGRLMLFEADNPWGAAWADVALQDGLRPLLLPPAEFEPTTAVPADWARTLPPETWRPLAARLGTDVAILAEARLVADAAGAVLDLTLRTLEAPQETTVVQRFQAAPDAPLTDLFRQAATAGLGELEEQWKRGNLLNFEQRGQLLAQSPLADLADLVRLRRALQQTAAVRRFEILSLSRRQAQFLLHMLGEPGQVTLALAQRGVELRQDGETWRLTVRQPAGPQ